MAKKSKNGRQKQSHLKVAKDKADEPELRGDEDQITWDDIAAMSDSDDEVGADEAIELNKKAKDLRRAITENLGGLLTSLKKNDNNEENDEFEEDFLDESTTDGEDETDDIANDESGDEKIQPSESDDEEEVNGDDDMKNNPSFIEQIAKGNGNDESDNSEDEIDEGGEEIRKKHEKYAKLEKNNSTNSKALAVVAAEMNSIHSKMPWAETFSIIPSTPLPFGELRDPESNPLDIHDDLKREVAFYNAALEAVNLARPKCQLADIPFTRPNDFFVEMVKTDDHMANVKDRLIFENKKIEAVAQRKSNKEQKLRAKESQANRLAEKAKRKKEHFQEVEEWANSAAKHRGGAFRDDVDDHFLNNRYNGSGPSKKRQNADRKFGFGGKRGRFKQNDRKSMNDMSGFNPRGNFSGGMKKTNKNDGSGSGANRAGKRARDAKRAKR